MIMDRHVWRITIVTRVLPSRDYQIRGAIAIAQTNKILKCPVNKLFTVRNTYHGSIQTDKAKERKLRWEAAVTGELKIKYKC